MKTVFWESGSDHIKYEIILVFKEKHIDEDKYGALV
jgi:hypothetical protein